MALSSHEIKAKFLAFFASKQHTFVQSSPIVVKGDPTLMFTNAGMNQFKDYFLGNAEAPYKRVVNSQKCLRVSGKHNDLEEVGHDHYHHTMFEMLGNWSFGDFFKQDAIAWAWELMTEVYGLPKDQLYVTVFEGDAAANISFDQEAHDRWAEFIDPKRILKGNKKDNFWEMGDTGPCGPCSEIHFDMRSAEQREAVDGATLVNQDHPEVIEIWNLVFMEFNRKADGSLERLPAQHVDTGMGFERLVRGIQGKSSNYDTDIFQFIIQNTAKLCGKNYGDDEKQDIAFRVIADHLRAVSLCIADGQLPSNTGAGYVVRRVLRRAVRYGYSYLGFQESFFNQLVPALADYFASSFPELKAQESFVQRVIQEEENSFFRTLSTGMGRLGAFIDQHPNGIVDGATAFELYDTFGFPIDLTDLIARERGCSVDMDGFQTALQAQKDRSKADAAKQTGDWHTIMADSEESFCGYDTTQSVTEISRHRTIVAKGKNLYQVVLDICPFYAESGGQVGDSGQLVGQDGEVVQVLDTQKENKLHVLVCDKLPKNMNQAFTAQVDVNRRNSISSNHSATHLMHSALREALGTHVAQKGSLVNDTALRFDFSHFGKMTDEEIAQVEVRVNEKIREGIALKEHRNVPIAEAQKIGATALFGEKYGEFVRVIEFDADYSMELCGGTHVANTSQIGFFKILGESSVAAGVRRIEAVTQQSALDYINGELEALSQVKIALGNPKDVVSAVNKVLEENASMRKQMEQMELQQVMGLKAGLMEKVQTVGGVPMVIEELTLPSADAAKQLCFQLKQSLGNPVVVLAYLADEKPGLAIYIDDQWVAEKGWNASQMIRECAKEIQGGGGGQPFFATAGGKNAAGLSAALASAKSLLGA
ncbi:MAG: alanine--tRNA ligase [Bacteroidia bacterium]|nr:alanine--tRNA ligase [Bacteroidia bacterium]